MTAKLLLPLVVLVCGACRHSPPDTRTSHVEFIADGGLLIRRDDGGRRALLALDSATAPAGALIAPRRWSPAQGSTFNVAATRFRHVAPSPRADWVAFETEGTHELVGVVAATGRSMHVLDFFFDSSADSLRWASAGRYLTAYYTPPSGVSEVRVYDAATGKRVK